MKLLPTKATMHLCGESIRNASYPHLADSCIAVGNTRYHSNSMTVSKQGTIIFANADRDN